MSRFWTLRVKLMIFMAVLLGSTAVLLISNNIRLTRDFKQTASEVRLAELSPLINSTLAASVFERDIAALKEKLNSVVGASGVIEISVNDANGETLWATGEAAASRVVKLTTPISLADEPIGTASVLLSTEPLDTAQHAVVAGSLLIGLSATLAAVLALGLFGHVVMRRLADLEGTAVAIAGGNLTVRAPATGHDEVAKVARAFNAMVAQLRAAKEKAEFEKTQLEMAIQAVDAGVYDIRVDDSSLYRSQRLKDIIGVSQLPKTRQAWRERIHPDDVGAYVKRIEDLQTGRIPTYRAEYRIRHDDGDYRCIRERGRLFRDMAGSSDRIVGLLIDVTEQKETETALRQSQQRFKALVKRELSESQGCLEALIYNLPFPISLKDLEGRFQYVGPLTAKNIGSDISEILGKTPHELAPLETAVKYTALDREGLAVRCPITREFDTVFNDGQTRTLVVTNFPVIDADGQLTGIAGLSTP